MDRYDPYTDKFLRDTQYEHRLRLCDVRIVGLIHIQKNVLIPIVSFWFLLMIFIADMQKGEPMSDLIDRQAAIDATWEEPSYTDPLNVLTEVRDRIKALPPAQPEQHIDADGTLWVTVTDIGRVTRVIVDEEKSKFCRQFYMDAQPEQRTGRWIPQDHNKRAGNISTFVYYYPTCSECGQVGNETYKYCPHCGAKMTEGDAE